MLIPWIIAFKLYILPVYGQLQDNHYDLWLQSSAERSVDVMTDVVNELGILILQQYVGHGNVAFSPSGVSFVLIALYEGCAGRGRHQIGHALGLPRSDQVTRIGMRDIHRRLRSYLNADGFLGGLTLNKDNINLRPEYESILKFYGFDLFDKSNVTSSGQNSTEASNVTSNNNGTAEIANNPITIQMTTMPSVSSAMITQTPPALSAINNAAGSTMSLNSSGSATTDNAALFVTTDATMTNAPANDNANAATTMATPANDMMALNTVQMDMAVAETIAVTVSSPLLLNETTGSSTDYISTETSTTINYDKSTLTTTPTATSDIPTTQSNPNESNSRSKRSTNSFFNHPSDDGSWMQDLNAGYQYQRIPGDYDSRDETHVSFLVNGCDVISVPAATYSAVLPFAYFPSLKTVALEFPLDDPRYNIIIFLPTERTDTMRLVKDLSEKSLRLLRRHLYSTWVRATIPSFTLRGFVTLTPFLQRLGIKDVFEPRVADLSPMTADLGVYARDVQQSIAVNISNDMNIGELNTRQPSMPTTQTETSSRAPFRRNTYRFLRPDIPVDKGGPATFIVKHPFLYFIIDAHTSVTLIAGRIEDPLNSRIL